MKDSTGKTFKFKNYDYLKQTKRLTYRHYLENYKKNHRKGIILKLESKLTKHKSKTCIWDRKIYELFES